MKAYSILFLSGIMVTSLLGAKQNSELQVSEDRRAVSSIEGMSVVSYADVLDEAIPAVVAVYTSRIVAPSYYQRAPQGIQDLLRQLGRPVPEPEPNQKEHLERVGAGSGVIISDDGYIITNHHVVQVQRGQAADEIRVRLGDDTEYVATLVGSDEKTDVAVLKIEPEVPLSAITIADSSKLRVGDITFAIGNPLDVGMTATQGIVSALGRHSERILGDGAYENFIQTDAAINLGNSGGALIDAAGRLIGINTAIASGNGGSIGIGFAIPTNLMLNVAQNLIETGEVQRGLLGLIPVDLTSDLADSFGLSSTHGALVNQVMEGSPAEFGGIRHGDIIVKVDEVKIKSAPQLRIVVSQMRPGREVNVTLIRQQETMVLPVVLGSLDGSVAMEAPGQSILEGVELKVLDGQSRSAQSIPDALSGVFVVSVDPDSPYSDLMGTGIVILEVNHTLVTTPAEIETNLKEGVNHLYVWSAGVKGFIVIHINE